MSLLKNYRGLVLIFAIAILTGWYFYSRYTEIRFNALLADDLLELAQIDVAIDRDVERITTFRLPHYDSLTQSRTRLMALLEEVDDVMARGRLSEKLKRCLQDYLEALENKQALGDQIVSHVALIRNSLLYLPTLVHESAQALERDDGLVLEQGFLVDLYIHYLFPDRIDYWEMKQKLARLKADVQISPLLVKHADLSIEQMQLVKGLRQQMQGLRTGKHFAKLQNALQDYRATREQRSLLLGGLALSLVFLLLLGLWRANQKIASLLKETRKAHALLRDAVESLGEAFILFDGQDHFVLANETFVRFYPWLKGRLHTGIHRKEIEALNASHIERMALDKSTLNHALPAPEGMHFIEQVDGERWYLGGNYPTSDGGVVCVRTDITQTKKAEHELQKLGRALEQSPASVVITDTKGIIEYVNPKFEEVSGYSAEEVIGKTPAILKSGEKTAEEYRRMWQDLKAGKEWLGVFHNRRKDGSLYWESARISPVRDENGNITHFIGVKEDITQRKRDQAQILYQATYDLLTGLPNRTLLTDRLTQLVLAAERKKTSFCVLFIDLDRFKVVNDLYGHVTGDELLQQVALRLQESVRASDTVSRFGGDEFVVLLDRILSVEHAKHIALKIIQVLSMPFELGHRQITIGASIGIARYPDNVLPGGSCSQVSSELLSNADMAMYHAKAQGGNHYCLFERRMQDEMKRHLELEQDLSHAVRRQELVVLYQPIHRACSHEIHGVEALLRWHHPQLGWIQPSVFIPLAEEAGLIGEIGEWVLQQACKQLAFWHEKGLKLHLSVNISARQRDKSFDAQVLRHILAETGLAPQHLTLEITENLLLDESKGASQWINQLKAVGIRLAVDDFGTGYSSLSYLKRFPVDSLKIDRSFVLGLPGDKDDVSLVEAIIALATSLGIDVVAEGVETAAQCDFLEAKGCHYLQGFYFAPPLCAKEIEKRFLVR